MDPHISSCPHALYPGSIVIKENLGVEDQLRDEDTTVDEDGDNKCGGSNMTDGLVMSSPKPMRGNTKRSRTGHTWVWKKAKVVISTEPREVPCDRCQMKGWECLP